MRWRRPPRKLRPIRVSTSVHICTPDKDLAQSVRGTRVVQMDRRARTIRDEAGVIAKFGVPPASIPDYLALVGDSSDGYPGLAGWGAKSAAAVLAKYGHIESIPADWTSWGVNASKPADAGRHADTGSRPSTPLSRSRDASNRHRPVRRLWTSCDGRDRRRRFSRWRSNSTPQWNIRRSVRLQADTAIVRLKPDTEVPLLTLILIPCFGRTVTSCIGTIS